MPVLLFQLFESIDVLNNSVRTFTDNCIKDLIVIEDRCAHNVEHSASLAAALIPIIGYEKASAIVRKALERNETIFAVAEEYGISRKEIEDRLNPLDTPDE